VFSRTEQIDFYLHFFLDTCYSALYTFVNCGEVAPQYTNRENRNYGNEKGSQEGNEEGS
jgi:hypothetical protein